MRTAVARANRLSEKDHQAIIVWAIACAQRVLNYFEVARPGDDRPRKALAAGRAWMRGKITMGELRKAALAAHAAAREVDGAGQFAGRAAGHAAATGHVYTHGRHAAAYAVKAVAAAQGDAEKERAWQRRKVSRFLRGIIFSD